MMPPQGPGAKHVLVVGAGATGSALAHYLAKAAPGIRLSFWEKSRGPGGRFATMRSREPGLAIVDHGAQYITRGAGGSEVDAELYDELLSSRVIQPFTGLVDGARPEHASQQHYVCREGMSSIAAHLLAKAGSAVTYERRARELNVPADDGVGPQQWHVTDTEGRTALFDAVVLTLPTPQLLELEGWALWMLLAENREALVHAASRYSTRWAACAWFDDAAWPALAALPWTSKYVKGAEAGTDALVYLSVEPAKRELAREESGPAVLLHSSVPYGIEHADADPEAVHK